MNQFSTKPRRILWITDQWPSAAPEWGHPDLHVDLFCLGGERGGVKPQGRGSLESKPLSGDEKQKRTSAFGVDRVLTWPGRTGFTRGEDGRLRLDSRLGLQNEELRRWFRDVLSEHRWDACVLDGLQSAAPLLGDHGLEVPRSLSWLIYRRQSSELEVDSDVLRDLPVHKALWARVESWRLRRIEETVLQRAVLVLREGESIAPDLWQHDPRG